MASNADTDFGNGLPFFVWRIKFITRANLQWFDGGNSPRLYDKISVNLQQIQLIISTLQVCHLIFINIAKIF